MATKKNNEGQALLIVLLAMATLATFAMSIVSRSISQVEVTNREEESIRAFSAAEAGLEQALVSGTIGSTLQEDLNIQPGNNAAGSTVGTFNAAVTTYPENSTEFVYPIEIASGEAATIWFVTKDGSNYLDCSAPGRCYTASSITLCWGDDGAPDAPAVSLTFAYENSGGQIVTRRALYDPVSAAARGHNNNFDSPSGSGCTIDGQSFRFSHNIALTSGVGLPMASGRVQYMKVRLLYNTMTAQSVGVRSGGGVFPAQGKKVTSTGTSGNSTRKIEAYLLNSTIPSIFDTAIYSPPGLYKN